MLSLPQILFLQCLLDITHGTVTMFWQGPLPPENLQDMLGRYKEDSCIWSPLLLHRHLWSSSSTLPACISDLSPKPMASAFSTAGAPYFSWRLDSGFQFLSFAFELSPHTGLFASYLSFSTIGLSEAHPTDLSCLNFTYLLAPSHPSFLIPSWLWI